jgi:drug/metabolite transporter (DMT)-like permease
MKVKGADVYDGESLERVPITLSSANTDVMVSLLETTTDTLATVAISSDASVVSVLLLNLVAILWGTQHAVIKTVVESSSDPAALTLMRFGLAALLASPYTPGLSNMLTRNKKDATTITNVNAKRRGVASQVEISTTWRWGREMGLWMFLGFAFQAVGLQSTTAQRSGFLLYLNVKFVPFSAWILSGREISTATWVSAVTAFAGTALLAWNGENSGFAMNVGDLWTIAAAAVSAMFILRLERASAQVADAAGLNSACMWVVTLLSGAWTVLAQFGVAAANDNPAIFAAATVESWWSELCSIALHHPLELFYLGGVTTALTNWIQTKAQRDVTAERASVIYAMDPVYGAAFSYLLLGETLNGLKGWIGAGLITLAAATNALLGASFTVAADGDLVVN